MPGLRPNLPLRQSCPCLQRTPKETIVLHHWGERYWTQPSRMGCEADFSENHTDSNTGYVTTSEP